MHHPKIAAVTRLDPRYAYEAYEFVFAALAHAEKLLGRSSAGPAGGTTPSASRPHLTGAELLHGIRDLALREFGLMGPSCCTASVTSPCASSA
jgi:uncharacterized repeat protein (TIGR04138 family)